MRVLEPHHFKYHTQEPSRRPILKAVVILVVILLATGGGYWYWNGEKQAKIRRQAILDQQQAQAAPVAAVPKTTPKVLTGEQFRDLYRAVMPTYPNTEAFPEPPSITGNVEADQRIRTIAERRGFQQTRIPVTALVKTNEPLLKDQTDDLLQPLAFQSWQQLKEAAKHDNIPLALLSAYRSPDWQRDLFMSRLLSRGVTIEQIAAGQGDAAVEATLLVTAIPGYSRHHAGYTVDFWCEDGSGAFANSRCFKWLNENNYLNAKQFGWMPSYPEGGGIQGPEPEPWEYVWVGHDYLYQ